jgi:3-methyladenine DNA glycosylase Tag
MSEFSAIAARAAERKGGMHILKSMLPAETDREALISQADGWFLGEMTRAIFQAGFVWRVIENKWAGFREAFFEFEPRRLMRLSDEDWQAYVQDARIVRNRQKILAVRHNLWFVHELSQQHGGFGRFLADWPTTDLVGLFGVLKKQGSRLGGNTGQYFLQAVGVDSFALTRDVVTALQLDGLEISDNPSSLKDLKAIQQRFNGWREQGDWSYRQMSHILAFSVGENRVLPDA